MMEELPEFGSIRECPKCGNTGQFFTKYSRINWTRTKKEHVIWEVLQVMCGNCSWVGQTKTKDAK